MTPSSPEVVLLGNLLVDDIVLRDGSTLMGEPGGAVLHAALAAALWGAKVGICSVAGTDYPATQQLIDLLQQYAKAEPKALAINAFSAWLLWAAAAKSCGDNLTRACVMQKASSTANWTAGGLHAPETPGNGGSTDSACFLALQATSKGFVVNSDYTNATEGLFNCDPKNVTTVSGFTP